jgi:transcription termination factor NusB
MSRGGKPAKGLEITYLAIFSASAAGADPLACLDGVMESQVEEDHPLRLFLDNVDPGELSAQTGLESRPVFKDHPFTAAQGAGVMLLQFWKDLSDARMERELRDKLEIRWFCGYNLSGDSPGAAYLSRLKEETGSGVIARLLKKAASRLKKTALADIYASLAEPASILAKLSQWREEPAPRGRFQGLCDTVREAFLAWNKNREEVDSIILGHLSRPDMSQVPMAALAALRLGISQMEYAGGMSGQVIIDRAVQLAKTYGDKDLAGFVNGVLDARLKTGITKGDDDE